MLVLKLPWNTWAPADAIVSADHIRNRSARSRGTKTIGTGNHVGDLVPAPAMPLNTDRLLIHKSAVHYFLNRRKHTVQSALSREANLVGDIRFQYQIAVADVVTHIDRMLWAGLDIVVHALRKALVDVHQQRILLLRIEIFRLIERPFQRHAVRALEMNQLRGAPEDTLLL